MLAEFTVVPIGVGESLSKYVSESLKIIDGSGINYRINPMGTVVEGEYDEVMAVVKKCHENMLRHANRVVTTIKIDDRKGVTNALDRKIKSVEEKLGKELKK